jgi:hypothetical protein
MAAFDLNSLYFIKNAAPKTTSFEEVVAPMRTGFDLGTAYKASYNKNSLQNLIAQREKEGIPYDRLSNEAAKWDLGAANGMRQERRASLDYNYKQSVDEFERWRKNMARRICGLILQKADEIGVAPEELDRVLNVAASYVVTYDEALAQWLLSQAQTRRTMQNKLNNKKPVNDHEKEISNTVSNMMNLSDKDLQSNPKGWADSQIRGAAGNALLRYKRATGNNIWLRQMAELANLAQAKFPKWGNAGQDAVDARAWLDGLDAAEIESLVGEIADPSVIENAPMESEPAVPEASGNTPKNSPAKAASVATAPKPSLFNVRMWTMDASGKKIPANGDKAQKAIDDATTEEELRAIRTALQSASQVWTKNDNDANQYKDFLKQIEDKIKTISSPVSEKIKAKFDAGMTGEQRTALSTQRNSFTTAISNYNNGTYMAAIGPILRASNPQERSTDQDVMRALQGQDNNTYSKIANLASAVGFKNASEAYLRENAGELVYQLMLPLLEKQRLSVKQQLERVDFDSLDEKEKKEVLKYLSDQYQMPVAEMAKYFEIPGYPKPKQVPWKSPEKNSENVKKIIEESKSGENSAVYTKADWANF